MNKALFLDRDGVINKLIIRKGKAQAPYSLSELEIFEGVKFALKNFKELGFFIIVVTNQPDVKRGWTTKENVELINSELKKYLIIDEFKICYHDNFDQCLCRKPMPGMLLEAGEKFKIDYSKSYMIGDRYSDVEAGMKAGCNTVLIGEGDSQNNFSTPDFRANSLLDFFQKNFV